MTTYILHGGRTKIESENNKMFLKQFTNSVPKTEVNILLCYWAREQKEWNRMFEIDKRKRLPNADITY